MPQRLAAIDWMRGFVMVLMAVDHASIFFNGGRVATDSAYTFGPDTQYLAGAVIPPDQFWTRWITHICAPTFLFLSGTSLALSTRKRIRSGQSPGAVDRHLLIRGLVLLGLEFTYISLGGSGGEPFLILQVLYAIGLGLILMIPLRRLPTPLLVAVALLWFFAGELLTLGVAAPAVGPRSPLTGFALAPGRWPYMMVVYPVLPWLAMMALGWAFGERLVRLRDGLETRWNAERICFVGGAAALSLFALVRGLNGYGNMTLYRADGSLLQWLHASKYPPSLAFASLELGLMAVGLGALLVLQRHMRTEPRRMNPLLVFGQTALFFYLVHFALLFAAAEATGLSNQGGASSAFIAAALVLVPLYPMCLWYRRYKAAHRSGWPQYI